MHKTINIGLTILTLIFFCNCATITKDESQPVAFSSEPQGAEVSINSVPMGTTPTTVMVKRKMGTTMVGIYKEGYHKENFALDKSVAAMTFGNIIFGGIIGVGVDVATGKATDYQESVHVNLRPLVDSSSSTQQPEKPKSDTNQKQELIDFRRKVMKRYTDGDITEEEYLKILESSK